MRCSKCWKNAYKKYILTNKQTDNIEEVCYLCEDCIKELNNIYLLERL